MPRRRYYKRTGNRDKYSVEHTCVRTNPTSQWSQVAATSASPTTYQSTYVLVTSTDMQGMRKVKHLTITASNAASSLNPLYYAVVFVPSGYEPQDLVLPNSNGATDIYPANQYVMSCGWLDFDGGPLRIRSKLSRNLNSGDAIALILGSYSQNESAYYVFDVTYAITLQ